MSKENFDRKVVVRFLNTEYEDFRIHATVRKDLNGEPNEADITVYGLSRRTEAAALEAQQNTIIQLEAGYDGTSELIFEGQPIPGGVTVERDGEDKTLKIEAADGRQGYQETQITLSAGEVRSYQQTLEEITRFAAAQNPHFADSPVEIQPDIPNGHKRLPRGMVWDGNLRDVADTIAEDLDCDWSFQNGTFIFLHKDAFRPVRGPLFSADNGNLINAPAPQDNGIEITGLLTACDPGQRYRVQSRLNPRYNGDYKAIKTRYELDSGYDGPFYVQVEGRPT